MDLVPIVAGDTGRHRITRDQVSQISSYDWQAFIMMLQESAKDKGLKLTFSVDDAFGHVYVEWEPA